VRRPSPALLALLAGGLPPAAHAFEDPDEAADLALYFADGEVRAASLAPRPVPRAPATVHVITAADITAWGDRSLADVLARVPGLSLRDDGVLPDAGVRGVHVGAGAPGRTLKVMIDGRPVSDRLSDAVFLGPELLPIDAVERVEVVKGPLSALYGANAFLAVVNVVTRSGDRVRDGLARVEAWKGRGLLEGAGLSATTGHVAGPLEVLLAFSAGEERLDGRRVPRTSPVWPALVAAGRTETRDDASSWMSAFARAGVDPGRGWRLALDGSVRSLDRADPFEDRHPLSASGTSRTGLLAGEARLSGEAEPHPDLGVAANVAYAGVRPSRSDRLEVGHPDWYLRRRYGSDGLSGGAALRWRLPDLPLLGPGELSLAGDGSWDLLRVPTWRRVARSSAGGGRAGDETPLSASRDARLHNLGVLAEAALRPLDALDLTLGGRLDRHSVYGLHPTARAALVWEVGWGLSAKALAGTSFLAPSPELLYVEAAGPGDVVGNPLLSPQHARAAELALAWRPLPGATLSLSGYAVDVEDLVVLRRRGLDLVATNATRLDVLGAEAEAELRRGPVVLRLGLAWADPQRAADPHTSEPLFAVAAPAPLWPSWSGSLAASLRLPRLPFSLHWDGRWAGERPASDVNALLHERRYSVAGHFLLDLAVASEGWRPFGGREVRVRADLLDVMNEAPADPGVGGVDLPGLGRRVRLTAELRL